MKFVFAFLFFAATFSAKAQQPGLETALAAQATQVSRALSQQLQLNEQEYIQVKKLTLEKLRAIHKIQENYAYHPVLLRQKLQETESHYQRQITYALNAGQVEQYLAHNPEAGFAFTPVNK